MNVIITGANRGIGKAITEEFAKNGYNIWACARNESDEFTSFLESLREKHNVEIEGISLNEDELKILESIAKNYKMSAMKLVAFIMNQYYEGKENEQ